MDNQAQTSDISAAQPAESAELSAIQSVLQTQVNLEHSETRRGLRVREDVFLPLVFHKGKHIVFKRKHLLLLDAWKPGVPLARAAEAAGMTQEQAMRFLRRKDVRLWLHDLAKEAAIKNDWDRPEKWYAMADDWLSGRKSYDSEGRDIEIWKELGARAVPKPSRNAPAAGPTQIEININPGAVDRALQRQQSIDTKIADENAA